MLDPAEADDIAALDDGELAARDRARVAFDPRQDHGRARARAVPADARQTARHFAADRIALVGEAAHVIPPIGAQGLNLGLRDAAAIGEVAVGAYRAGDDIGGD